MNALILLLHLIVVGGCTLLAFRKGAVILTVWIALQSVLANLFVLKQIDLFGATITCSDAFAVGTLFGLNLLREYVGKEWAERALKSSIYLIVFFLVMSQIHLLYRPSHYDQMSTAYQQILSTSPRLFLASLATFYLMQKLELRLFGWLKTRWPRLPFFLRNMSSTTLSQILDTLLFSFLGLYGLVCCLVDIIVMSTLTKIAVILCMGPLLHLAKYFAPNKETHAPL